jgi:signal transduction histidine kinase
MAKTMPEFPTHFDLGAFLSRESHDLRAPFNHIVGFSRIVLKGQEGPLTDFQREDLTTVYNSGVRALFMLSSLIEIARISAGKKELSLAEIELTPFINEVVVYWRRNNPAKDVQIEFEISIASPTMYADETQLRQVISSLVSYVVEYTQHAAKVILTMSEQPDWLVTTIQSVGQKASSQSALDLEMLGYISRAYIEQHGGEIRVREETDEGAVICFTLPKRSGAELPASET